MHALTDMAAGPGANGAAKPLEEDVFVFPMTAGQQGFWYLNLLRPGSPAYHIAVRFRLQGRLRADALERALNEVVRRHESLRTVFAVVDGAPAQVVLPRLTIRLRQDDLRGAREEERDGRARAIAIEEGRLRFDLTRGPLIRARLLQLGDEDHTLLVTIHHIVSDGWSIGVLTRELGALYDAYCRGLGSPLPELALQYGDFAVWQEQWLRSRGLDEQATYWARQLADLLPLELPTDRPRPTAQTFNGHIESVLLPRELTDRLEALCAREKTTLFTLMLAALKLLLQRHTGQSDVYVGSVVAGRSRVELEPLIGLFINPLVLRTNLAGDPTFLELLRRVRETVLQGLANQDVPFERVVEAARPKRDPSRHPVFQINFLFQRDFVQPFRASGVTLTAIPSVSPGAIVDLNFFMVERAEGWRASCEYNTDLYHLATIRRVLGQLQGLLEEIEAAPGRRLSELPLPARQPGGPTTPGLPAPGLAGGHVAPRDPVESQLEEIWARVLGVDRVSVDADLFDIGGTSLVAARLLARVEKAFGEEFSLASLLQCPTIESLAARISAKRSAGASGGALAVTGSPSRLDEEKWAHPEGQVFPMSREGARPPLLLVDGGPFLRPLVRRLGSEQPVFGVALPRLAALPERFTVQDIAANLIDGLRKSPVGPPYYLAGWSHAGLIAYEVARQLRARGEDVALVALFDTNRPAYLRRFERWWKFPVRLYLQAEKWLYHALKVRRMPWGAAWRAIRERMQRFRLDARKAQRAGKGPSGEGEGELAITFSWQMQYVAAAAYDPKPLDVPLALFRSEALQTGWFRDPRLGWGDVAPRGLRVYEMPGEHDAMFLEPGVQRLASLLTECLRG